MNLADATSRFSDRADNYHLYRPAYPAAVIAYVQQVIGLNSRFSVADIGSGTGIFSSLFLKNGYAVQAVEPNAAMRSAAIKYLQAYHGFESIDGTAEHTSLPDRSTDLITVAQAFHWFNLEEVKKEFTRILTPGGHVLLVWNLLQTDTPFLQAYNLLKNTYAEKNTHPDYGDPDSIRQFFAPNPVTTHQFSNIQYRDAAGLEGLLASSSKVPLTGEVRYEAMINELHQLVKQHATNGLLKLEYETKLYLAKLDNHG